MLLFCGFFIPMNDIPSYLQWLSYCSYARYTFQSIVLTFYSMDRPFLYCNKTLCPFEDPKVIIKELDMEGELYVDYSALVGFFILFKLITYLVLKLRTMRIHWVTLVYIQKTVIFFSFCIVNSSIYILTYICINKLNTFFNILSPSLSA